MPVCACARVFVVSFNIKGNAIFVEYVFLLKSFWGKKLLVLERSLLQLCITEHCFFVYLLHIYAVPKLRSPWTVTNLPLI